MSRSRDARLPLFLVLCLLLLIILLAAASERAAAETTKTTVVSDPTKAVAAIEGAGSGDTVSLEFSAADNVVKVDKPISINKSITIDGSKSEGTPFFDGQNKTRVMEIINVPGGPVKLINFGLRNGNGKSTVFDGHGGLFYNANSNLELYGVTFENGKVGEGKSGGCSFNTVHTGGPVVAIKYQTVLSNKCSAGALGGAIGVVVQSGEAQVDINDSVFNDSSALTGGALYAESLTADARSHFLPDDDAMQLLSANGSEAVSQPTPTSLVGLHSARNTFNRSRGAPADLAVSGEAIVKAINDVSREASGSHQVSAVNGAQLDFLHNTVFRSKVRALILLDKARASRIINNLFVGLIRTEKFVEGGEEVEISGNVGDATAAALDPIITEENVELLPQIDFAGASKYTPRNSPKEFNISPFQLGVTRDRNGRERDKQTGPGAVQAYPVNINAIRATPGSDPEDTSVDLVARCGRFLPSGRAYQNGVSRFVLNSRPSEECTISASSDDPVWKYDPDPGQNPNLHSTAAEEFEVIPRCDKEDTTPLLSEGGQVIGVEFEVAEEDEEIICTLLVFPKGQHFAFLGYISGR